MMIKPEDYEYDTSKYIRFDIGVSRDPETGILMTEDDVKDMEKKDEEK